ncbi:MAG: hypothetical protein K6V97_13105 [Actinomycetia bacterium]|nr:hypothetical protein [Actinomycetes bacterium]
MTLLAVVRDLGFQSRILETLAGLDVRVRFVSPGPTLEAALAAERFDAAVVDLTVADAEVFRALGAVGRVLAFGPHVERERFRQARAAGVARVVANGRLDRVLPRWLAGEPVADEA